MLVPLEIRFHNLDRSPAIEAAIHERVEKLEQFADRIQSCRVTVEAPHHHHHKGNLYHVSIDIRLPGGEVVVSRGPGEHGAHEDVYVAVRDAFKAARRQIEDYVRVRRGKVKEHEAPLHGRIAALEPDQDFGRITSSDGRSIYFHRNSVVNASFDELEIDTEVRFDEEPGDEGPQATSVQIIGKHHIVD